jgi:lactate dehydrogenase-like 2-hydroxyacid dehydrogenase
VRSPGGLIGSSKTVLQAHCGGKTHEAYRVVVEQTVRRLKAHFDA